MIAKISAGLAVLSICAGAIWLLPQGIHEAAVQTPRASLDRLVPARNASHAVRQFNDGPAIVRPHSQGGRYLKVDVVKCMVDGKVTYSDQGCDKRERAKPLEIHDAQGIESPPRAVIDATVNGLLAERAAEKARLESGSGAVTIRSNTEPPKSGSVLTSSPSPSYQAP